MKFEKIEKIAHAMKDNKGLLETNKFLERLHSTSFWELIREYRIEIPIIQRDYAQGRDNEKTNKIRQRFLEKMKDSLVDVNGSLELDFVYGDIIKDIFQPLDGQQRLTTLFLLHWYVAQMIEILPETTNQFSRFTYETRISSREFCSELARKGNLLGRGKTISEKIKDSSWYVLSWGKDPTIKSMLTMLDSIETLFFETDLSEVWLKLTSENSPIVFHFKELKDMGLTDDLYIKMNARGKELTDFEHFKARFEKEIDTEMKQWEKGLNDKPLETFSHKIDTIWTDLFWEHRGDDNLVDNEFIKFIAGVAINYYAQSIEIQESKEDDLIFKKELESKAKGKNVTNDAIKRERVERRIAELFNNSNDVSPEDFPSKDAFEYLKKCFDIYSENDNDKLLPGNLPLWDYCENKKVQINNNTEANNTLFIELIKVKETTYKQRALFYAQTKYLINNKVFNSESFSNWLRVIRNIIQNSTIDSASGFIGAIGLINEIGNGCNEIYKYLNTKGIVSGFALTQTTEEVLKSKLILDGYKAVVFDTEDTYFCKGKISFALYCTSFENPEDKFDAVALSDIQKSIEKHLSFADITNDFRRGLLTINDNKFYDYWNTSWLYAVKAPKRCLIKDITDLKAYAYNLGYRDYLKELLVQLTNIELSVLLSGFTIPHQMPNWKARIIKEGGLLDYSNKHFIAVIEDTCCWLIPQGKVSNSKEGVKKCKLIK